MAERVGRDGEMPISMVEFGTPMDCTFRRGRDGFTSNITSEPLLTEYVAIYFGNEAYAPRSRSTAVSSRPVPHRDALQQLREPAG